MAIPVFRPDGNLPEGVHVATLEEIEHYLGWNEWRRQLLQRVREWADYARAVGARGLVLDGSFVTAKDNPEDVDAVCWLPSDLPDQHRRGKVEAVLLYSMIVTKYPQELFGAETEESWNWWIRFFSSVRESRAFKGLVEVILS